MNKLSNYLFIFLFSLIIISCSNEANNSKEFIIESTLIASGPLFEGSNTCQSDLTAELNKFLEENGINEDELIDVKLKSCTIKRAKLKNFDIIESISLQLMSDNLPMQTVAVINPIKESMTEISLTVAEIQEEIKPILLDKNLYIIADAILKEDLEDDLVLESKLVFSINYFKE